MVTCWFHSTVNVMQVTPHRLTIHQLNLFFVDNSYKTTDLSSRLSDYIQAFYVSFQVKAPPAVKSF